MVKNKSTMEATLPVLPNSFPYNEMLLDGNLKVGRHEGVKTRSWSWKYRGPILLYTSTSTHKVPCEAYGYNPKAAERGVIVGVGELVNVRNLTEWEKRRLLCRFNGLTKKDLELIEEYEEYHDFIPTDKELELIQAWRRCHIRPFNTGFFFKNLRRFKAPVKFHPPRGAISLFRAPVSTVTSALNEVGFEA